MSKRISTSLLTLLAFPGAASAADLPSLKAPPAPPPPIFSWDGVYMGTHVGYGLNTVSEQATDLVPGYAGLGNPVGDSQNYSARGPLTGFQIGYNKQFGNFVLGGEWDVEYAGQNTSPTTFGTLGLATGGPVQTNIGNTFRWSTRARFGYADGRALYYVTGGMVDGGYSLKHYYSNVPGATPYTPGTDLNSTPSNAVTTSNFGNSGSFNIERFGWTVGAGIEYAFTDKWSANVEYRHNDFGTATVTSNLFPGLTFRERSYEDTVRLGINYHTGLPLFAASLPPAPVEALARARAPKTAAPAAAAGPDLHRPPLSRLCGRMGRGRFRTIPTRRRAAAPISRRRPRRRRPIPSPNGRSAARQPIGATLPNSIDSPADEGAEPDAGRAISSKTTTSRSMAGSIPASTSARPIRCPAR